MAKQNELEYLMNGKRFQWNNETRKFEVFKPGQMIYWDIG